MSTNTWPKGARLALSIVVNVEEGSELSIADGDGGPEPVDELGVMLKRAVRNYGNESNYRYGLKAGAPRVMRLLEEREFAGDIHRRSGQPGACARTHAANCRRWS